MCAKFMFVFMYCLLHPQVEWLGNFWYSFLKLSFIKVLWWFMRMLYAYKRRDKRMDKAIFLGTQQGSDDNKFLRLGIGLRFKTNMSRIRIFCLGHISSTFPSVISLSCCSSMTYPLVTSAVNKKFSCALDLSIRYFV